jgi:hypothetical protein
MKITYCNPLQSYCGKGSAAVANAGHDRESSGYLLFEFDKGLNKLNINEQISWNDHSQRERCKVPIGQRTERRFLENPIHSKIRDIVKRAKLCYVTSDITNDAE